MPIPSVGKRTLRDLWQEQARVHSDRPFLVYENEAGEVEQYSYAAFNAEINKAANLLQTLGVAHGDRVVVHMRNHPNVLRLWFALAKIGAIFVPNNCNNTARETAYVLSYSGASVVVTEPAFVDLVQSCAAEVTAVRHKLLSHGETTEVGWLRLEDLLSESSADEPSTPIAPDDVCQILFTSGTTAHPKGVMLTHANHLVAGERESMAMQLTAADRALAARPLYHVNAQTITVLSSLTVGATVVLLESYHASRFIEQLCRHGATTCAVGPAFMRTMLAQKPSPQDRAHRLTNVPTAINPTDAEKEAFEQRFGVRLVNGYGLSEAFTMVTQAPMGGERHWPSIGRPVIGRTVRLVDADGGEVAPGVVGEITVRGELGFDLMAGYYRAEEQTRQTVVDGWLHTGDLATVDEAGRLYFYDRAKDIIKRGGENVAASEVEGVLLEHPAVAEAAVLAVPHPVYDQTPMAVVVFEAGASVDVAELEQWCRQRLAKFKVPTVWESLSALPRRFPGSAKVDKGALRSRYGIASAATLKSSGTAMQGQPS